MKLLDFVVDCNLPFSTIQQPSFGSLLRAVAGADVSIPSNTVFMKFLKTTFDDMKMKLSQILRKQKYVCVTCDVWSSHAQAYLGMTVHFYNDRLQLESYVLAFRQLKERQTHAVMASEILKVFQEYGIEVKKITNIVTDGGSAFGKAFKVYGVGSDPLTEKHHSQNIDDVIPELMETEDENEAETIPFMQHEDGELFLSNIIQLDDDVSSGLPADMEGESNIESNFDELDRSREENFFDEIHEVSSAELGNSTSVKLPKQRRCLSHLLNLIAGDFVKALSGRAKTAYVKTFSKLQAIWVFPRRSSLAKTICKEVFGCVLIQPNDTRWNSKFDAVKHLFGMKDKINLFVEKLKTRMNSAEMIQFLNNDDERLIAAYIKVFEPVAIALDRLQGERNSGQGYILPTLYTMRFIIAEINGGGPITKVFQDIMLSVIDKRFGNYFKMDENTSELYIASLSTPLFKSSFIRHDSDFNLARRMIESACLAVMPPERIQSNDLNTTHPSEPRDNFFMSFSNRRNVRRSSMEQSVSLELDNYFEDARTELEMLHDYPLVKEVFLKFNTTLSSSGAVERLFNQSSLIFTRPRNRISPSNFEYCLLLHHNRRLIN